MDSGFPRGICAKANVILINKKKQKQKKTPKLHYLINNKFYRLLKFGHNFLQYFSIAAKRENAYFQ